MPTMICWNWILMLRNIYGRNSKTAPQFGGAVRCLWAGNVNVQNENIVYTGGFNSSTIG